MLISVFLRSNTKKSGNPTVLLALPAVSGFDMILADGSTLAQEIPSEKHFAALEQIHKWLNEAGFAIEQECGDYQGHPISEMTDRVII